LNNSIIILLESDYDNSESNKIYIKNLTTNLFFALETINKLEYHINLIFLKLS